MDIYKFSKEDIWEALKKFAGCEYGKIQFLLSYSVSFVMFFIMIILLVMLLLVSDIYKNFVLFLVFSDALFTLISFVVGSMHYYKELRFFVYKLKSLK